MENQNEEIVQSEELEGQEVDDTVEENTEEVASNLSMEEINKMLESFENMNKKYESMGE